MPRESVRSAAAGGEVARREAAAEQRSIEARVKSGAGYYQQIAPGHVNGTQFTQIVIGLLHSNPKLYEAASENPQSFLSALADCAMKGLVPGDGYALVPFYNKNIKMKEITGIIEYTGEIELMYRTGRVTAVVAEAVRVNDVFRRGRTSTDPPLWEPAGEHVEHNGQSYDLSGFGNKALRGVLRGVFAYAVIDGVHTSRVVYLGPDEIARRRAVAKTLEIWGPEWPAEGPNTEPMWLKSGVHALWGWVPKSAEYVAALLETSAKAAAVPVPPGLEPPAPAEAPQMLTAEPEPDGAEPS